MRYILILYYVIALFYPHMYCNAGNWTDSGNYETSWYNDLSSSFDISTAKELAGIAYLCNNGVSFTNKTINLQTDIDLSGYNWTPINTFDGIMNGNFHNISNFMINYTDNAFGAIKAFIINNTGEIENMELKGSVLLASRGYGAVSAGGLCVENTGCISNCIISCTVSAYNKISGADYRYNHNAGGVCVINKGEIINCVNNGDISAEPSVHDYGATLNFAGGIAGQNENTIINCVNYGNIHTVVGYSSSWKVGWGLPCGYAGGICGTNTGTINNVINLGNIEAAICILVSLDGTNSYGGGIVADNSGTTSNAYFSSSNTIIAPNILNAGTRLSSSQLNNTSYNFTDVLNQNIQILSDKRACFWTNSVTKNNNIPFHLNGFAVKTQVEDIHLNTAKFMAIPINISSSAITKKGFEYKKRDSQNYKKVYAQDDFSVEVSDLELSVKYVVRAFVMTTRGDVIYFNEIDFATSPITVETQECENITATGATLVGYVQSGTTPIQSQGFLWKEEYEKDFHVVYSTGQDFSYKLEGLQPNTSYYYQAFILTVAGESIYGDLANFSTSPVTITFPSPDIDKKSIYLHGRINCIVKTEVTIEYKKSTDVTYSNCLTESNDDGTFEIELKDLSPNTSYDCRAYINYNNVYYYSPIYTYTTKNIEIQTLSPILDTKVTFRGNVIGGENDAQVGFEYRDSNHPDMIKSDIIYSSLAEGITSFTAQTNNVTNNNTYKYRAFYIDSNNKYNYGDWVYFIPTDIISGINDIKYEAISIENGKITLPAIQIIRVYDAFGKEVYHGNTDCVFLGKGLYIININAISYKVMIK
ncbi:hypothetical protein H8744_16845 [Oscillospiraceae bacterium N12]|jgi:hypothetical protein|uniref:Fibronectin type-III domain-containing protein n=1 Tax=Jilunia laotingensis TaxID=2763675 RepID=A0A926FAP0_9BACT|nr:hypothetical protein [Jilunia laotingensis]MBC8594880.1 hypothetical protein [Jilunia laotingensis]